MASAKVTLADVGKGAAHAAIWAAQNKGAARGTVIGEALNRGRALRAAGATSAEALAYVTDFRTAAGHPYDATKDAGSRVLPV